MNQEILKDIGGTVVFDVPQMGRPSSATVTILNPSGGTVDASGAVDTIDAVNTTLSSGAAAGTNTIPLASVSNIKTGTRYVITNTKGNSEYVRPTLVSTSSVTIAQPLAFNYSSSNTFEGTTISHNISAANSADLGENYQASWVYVIDGVTYRANSFYDVVRAKWTDIVVPTWQFRLIAGDMASADLESLEASGLDFADEIAEATRRVRQEVNARGYRPALFRSFDTFVDPICYRVLLTFAERGEAIPAVWQEDPVGWLELRREVYADALTQALNNANYDANEDEVISEVESKARLGSARILL